MYCFVPLFCFVGSSTTCDFDFFFFIQNLWLVSVLLRGTCMHRSLYISLASSLGNAHHFWLVRLHFANSKTSHLHSSLSDSITSIIHTLTYSIIYIYIVLHQYSHKEWPTCLAFLAQSPKYVLSLELVSLSPRDHNILAGLQGQRIPFTPEILSLHPNFYGALTFAQLRPKKYFFKI